MTNNNDETETKDNEIQEIEGTDEQKQELVFFTEHEIKNTEAETNRLIMQSKIEFIAELRMLLTAECIDEEDALHEKKRNLFSDKSRGTIANKIIEVLKSVNVEEMK